jgi:hypothetical protein
MLHMGPLYQVIHRVYPAKHVHFVDADTRVLREISARQYGSGQLGSRTSPGGLQCLCAGSDRHFSGR